MPGPDLPEPAATIDDWPAPLGTDLWPYAPEHSGPGFPVRHKIIPDLWPLAVPLDDLAPLPRNPRKGDVQAMKASLDRFGQRKGLVVNVETGQHVIEAGNHTQAAARALNWTHLAIARVRDDPDTATGYAIADNRIAQLGGFDLNLLADATAKLHAADPSLLLAAGYNPDAYDDLLHQAGALPTSPIEGFQGGYAETDDEHQARLAHRDNFLGDEPPPVLREVILRYTPDAYDEVIGWLRAVQDALGLDNFSATVRHLALEGHRALEPAD